MSHQMASVRGTQKKGWVRPGGEGKPPRGLGLDFAVWLDDTVVKGRCYICSRVFTT